MNPFRLPLQTLALAGTGLTVAAQAFHASQAHVALQLVLLQFGVAGLLLAAPLRPGWQVPALLVGAVMQAVTFASWLFEGAGTPLLPLVAGLEAVVLGLVAGIVIQDARREARWNGVVPLRPEAW